MSIQEIAPHFKTSDGREFTVKAEAEKHQALVDAQEAFEQARRVLGRRLAESEKTADGRPFELSLLRNYYWVQAGWRGRPEVLQVSFDAWSCQFSPSPQGMTLFQPASANQHEVECRIRDLYVSKDAAERALLAAQEKWLEERAAEVTELRERLERPTP